MSSRSALLIIDVISDFEFEDGQELFLNAVRLLDPIKKLKEQFIEAGSHVFFVNDNDEGRFQSVDELLRHTSRSEKGRAMIEAIRPKKENIILKPQHSAFFGTNLDDRLKSKRISSVTVVGWTTDICVLFTAHDAFMRKLRVSVPSDCTTAVKPTHHEQALRLLKRVADADVLPVFQ